MVELRRTKSTGPAPVKIDRTLAADGILSNVPATERHFYARQQAFGRFGMRLFEPQIMPAPHWHGHIEANFLQGAAMVYDVKGEELVIPENRMAVFWASVPHQLTEVHPTGESRPRDVQRELPSRSSVLRHAHKRHQPIRPLHVNALPQRHCRNR